MTVHGVLLRHKVGEDEGKGGVGGKGLWHKGSHSFAAKEDLLPRALLNFVVYIYV